jgi:hypothetical protein
MKESMRFLFGCHTGVTQYTNERKYEILIFLDNSWKSPFHRKFKEILRIQSFIKKDL